MNDEKQIGGGLIETPKDERDFKLTEVFGAIPINAVPVADFVVSQPLEIKDQGNSDLCTAFGVTAVSEDQEDIILAPEYQFNRTKELMGNFDAWGADLRTACKSAVKFGSLPRLHMPINHLLTNGRDAVGGDWAKELEKQALKYRKKSFFEVEGRNDTFDNFRTALWQNREEKRSIFTGVLWRNTWTHAPDGAIPNKDDRGNFGHAFKIYGQKMVQGKMHLVAQLSNGVDIGDRGIFYFPRDIINREFTYNGYMFKDLSPKIAKAIMESSFTLDSSIFIRYFYQLKALFS